jgi:hypothetical protein
MLGFELGGISVMGCDGAEILDGSGKAGTLHQVSRGMAIALASCILQSEID